MALRTTAAKALHQLSRGRRAVRAKDFNQAVRDRDWTGHIGRTNQTEPSCGCPVCQAARFNMEVRT